MSAAWLLPILVLRGLPGRPVEVTQEDIDRMKAMDAAGYTRSAIARAVDKDRSTVNRYIATPAIPTGGRVVGATGKRDA